MSLNIETAKDLVRDGFAALALDQAETAQQAFERALSVDMNCAPAYHALTRMLYPGDMYLDVLSRIHRHVKPRTYVEIGVSQGASLGRATPDVTACVGIDPKPLLSPAQAARAKIFPLRSDEFFAQHSLTSILDGVPVDLGFIDGHHVFEAALEDFCNLERYCAPNGTLMFHDCLPFNEVTAARNRTTAFWTGDVWRVIPALAHFRPDLSITVIRTPPSGLAIVRGLDPSSPVMATRFKEALAWGFALGFDASRDLSRWGIKTVSSAWSDVAPLFD